MGSHTMAPGQMRPTAWFLYGAHQLRLVFTLLNGWGGGKSTEKISRRVRHNDISVHRQSSMGTASTVTSELPRPGQAGASDPIPKTRPARPEIFTTRVFTEKVCHPHRSRAQTKQGCGVEGGPGPEHGGVDIITAHPGVAGPGRPGAAPPAGPRSRRASAEQVGAELERTTCKVGDPSGPKRR